MSEYASIDIKGPADVHDIGDMYRIEKSVVRVFANMPNHCAIQIRRRGGITNSGYGGKPRNMIATAQLDRIGLIELRDAINVYLEQFNG